MDTNRVNTQSTSPSSRNFGELDDMVRSRSSQTSTVRHRSGSVVVSRTSSSFELSRCHQYRSTFGGMKAIVPRDDLHVEIQITILSLGDTSYHCLVPVSQSRRKCRVISRTANIARNDIMLAIRIHQKPLGIFDSPCLMIQKFTIESLDSECAHIWNCLCFLLYLWWLPFWSDRSTFRMTLSVLDSDHDPLITLV
jgi:hypothetical protein